MMSFELRGGLEAGRRFCEALAVITRAVSLGGVESLIQHPASMSHLRTPAEVKARLGIGDGEYAAAGAREPTRALHNIDAAGIVAAATRLR